MFRVRVLSGAPLALLIAVGAAAPASGGQSGGILRDPVMLNIGHVCQWQWECMERQRKAMTKSLRYVSKHRPPEWRIHLCNRNARRTKARVDWIGFDRCVRNEDLQAPNAKSRRRPS